MDSSRSRCDLLNLAGLTEALVHRVCHCLAISEWSCNASTLASLSRVAGGPHVIHNDGTSVRPWRTCSRQAGSHSLEGTSVAPIRLLSCIESATRRLNG